MRIHMYTPNIIARKMHLVADFANELFASVPQLLSVHLTRRHADFTTRDRLVTIYPSGRMKINDLTDEGRKETRRARAAKANQASEGDVHVSSE